MKMRSLVALAVAGLLAAQPVAAVAASKKPPAPPTGAARAEQYAKALKWCQQKYGGPGPVSVEWAGRWGTYTWWCRHY